MIELYHFYGATCGLKARLAVAEKGISVVDRAVDRAFLKSPEYLALNPLGVVPTLVHDREVFRESSVIINYLDDLQADVPLKPATALGKARVLQWMKRADECLSLIGMLTYTVSMRPGIIERGAAGIEAYLAAIPSATMRSRRERILRLGFENPEFGLAVADLASMLQELEATLSAHSWLAGNDYTLADLAMTPLLERLEELTFAQAWETDYPRLRDWWQRIRSRPSFESCVMQQPNTEAPQHHRFGQEAWPHVKELLSA